MAEASASVCLILATALLAIKGGSSRVHSFFPGVSQGEQNHGTFSAIFVRHKHIAQRFQVVIHFHPGRPCPKKLIVSPH